MTHTAVDLLHPKMQDAALAAIAAMRKDEQLRNSGVSSIVVVETLRPLATQMAYYSRGRMAPSDVSAMYRAAGLPVPQPSELMQPITWTLASKHLAGQAIDIAPVRNGMVWWSAPSDVWTRMGEIGESHGLKWGGRWKQKDTPHFEMEV